MPPRQSPHRHNSVFHRCGTRTAPTNAIPYAATAAHTPTTQIAYVRFSFQRGRHRPLTTATQLTAQNAASRTPPGNSAAAVPHRKARSDNPATVVPYHKARPRQSHYRLCHTTRHAPEQPRCRLHPIANHTYRLPFVAVFLRVSPPAAPPFSTSVSFFRGLFHIPPPQNFKINFRFFTFPRIIFTPI